MNNKELGEKHTGVTLQYNHPASESASIERMTLKWGKESGGMSTRIDTSTAKEFMRITRSGIWVDPEIEVTEAARQVLACLEANILAIVQQAVAEEREQCAQVCEELGRGHGFAFAEFDCAEAIRGRKN